MAKPDRSKLEARVTALRAVLEDDPNDATAWYGLGRALSDLDAQNDAIVAFRRCIAARPDYAAGYRELGRCLLDAGEAGAAQLAFEDGIAAADESGDLQTAREMQTFLRRAQRAQGEAPAAPATGAAPTAPQPEIEVDPAVRSEARKHYKEGFEHYARGKTAPAIECYERALAVDPTLAIAWNGLSLAHAARREFEPAVDAARKLIELEPEDPLSHTNLSRLLMQQGLIPEAEEEKAVAMRMQMRAAKS